MLGTGETILEREPYANFRWHMVKRVDFSYATVI